MDHFTLDAVFQYLAVFILILFYSIYFGKMMIQRKKGIVTDQMGRGKKGKKLFLTELFLKIATYSVLIVELISIVLNTTHSFLTLKMLGIALGLIGVVIFGIAVFTMRDSWRAGIPEKDKTELVTTGIFGISRNPAFLAFDLVYLGLLLCFFNWVLLAFSLWAITMLHLQIKQEEKFLTSIFKEEYAVYMQQTKRYFGRRNTNI
jgi:protein-S-isoprenylcysteine O-methyltransferase Ste14